MNRVETWERATGQRRRMRNGSGVIVQRTRQLACAAVCRRHGMLREAWGCLMAVRLDVPVVTLAWDGTAVGVLP